MIAVNTISSVMILNDYNFIHSYGFQIEQYSWLLCFIYVFINIYRELYIGKNTIAHMIPIDTYKILIVKSVVFGVFMSIMWLVTLIYEMFSPMGMYEMRIIESSNVLESTLYFIIPRIVSLFTGVVVIGLAVALGKLVNNRVISNVIVFASFILITMGIYMVMKYTFLNVDGIGWSIGTTAQYGFKQYSGIIAILVSTPKSILLGEVNIASSIYWNNVFVNIFVGLIGLYISNLVFKSKKYELIGK
ncbi:hypothetical protein [Clostridium sp.]|uniref:hypothetical protein n=1 Tax=Clostridium sp. TaxID=1506 RepID=UPI002FCC34CF